MLPLGSIFNKHGISYHCYEDDTEFYFPFKAGNNAADCLEDVKCWMNSNFLMLNKKKSEIVIFLQKSTYCLGQFPSCINSHVTNLGVIFDSNLTVKYMQW